MTLGLSIADFTRVHVVISLVAIAAGLVGMVALASGRWFARTLHVFLATTLLTTVTGFMFPLKGFTPALGVGLVSTVVLLVAYWALYAAKLKGKARPMFAISAMLALYFNLFVLVVQSFLKIPVLHELAPNGNEPPFAIAQGVVLLACLVLGFLSLRGSRQQGAPPLPA